jgi:hypothetical protein
LNKKIPPEIRRDFLLHKLLLVDHKFEFKAEFCRGGFTKNHSVHENSEIIHNGTVTGIYRKLELDKSSVFVDFKFRFGNGIVYFYPIALIHDVFALISISIAIVRYNFKKEQPKEVQTHDIK